VDEEDLKEDFPMKKTFYISLDRAEKADIAAIQLFLDPLARHFNRSSNQHGADFWVVLYNSAEAYFDKEGHTDLDQLKHLHSVTSKPLFALFPKSLSKKPTQLKSMTLIPYERGKESEATAKLLRMLGLYPSSRPIIAKQLLWAIEGLCLLLATIPVILDWLHPDWPKALMLTGLLPVLVGLFFWLIRPFIERKYNEANILKSLSVFDRMKNQDDWPAEATPFWGEISRETRDTEEYRAVYSSYHAKDFDIAAERFDRLATCLGNTNDSAYLLNNAGVSYFKYSELRDTIKSQVSSQRQYPPCGKPKISLNNI